MLKTAVQQGPSNSLYLSLGEWPRLPFTARIERAQFHRARSASKKGTWPLPLLLAGFFSILLEHTLDGATGRGIQFSRDSSGLVCKPTGIHRIFHRLGHGNGILSPGDGRVHEYSVRP